MNSPRVSRAMPVQPVQPSTAMMCQIVVCSSMPISVRISTSDGNAHHDFDQSG